MIELIPAIDIIDGQCVRLRKGNFAEKTVYGRNPLEIAKGFEQMGLKRLHLVDLDGARQHCPVNLKVLEDIAANTSLTIDFGGGIRSEEHLRSVYEHGAAMANIGSMAVTHHEECLEWTETFGADRIVLCADTRDRKIAVNGWQDTTDTDIIGFLKPFVAKGIRNILCTDIARDGMLAGPATDLYKMILDAYPDINLIASGGISSNEDITDLQSAGVPAVVFGKAFYEGLINIKLLLNERR